MTLLMRDKEQQKLGKYTDKVSAIRKNNNEIPRDVMIRILSLDSEIYEKIIFYINNNPDWDDEEIADAVINDEES